MSEFERVRLLDMEGRLPSGRLFRLRALGRIGDAPREAIGVAKGLVVLL
jgi:hypothetical protein